jgi:hypothetical protein
MKSLTLVLLIVVAKVVLFGQEPAGIPGNRELKGKIKSIAQQRTYLLWKSRSVEQTARIFFLDRYDTDGHLIQSSDYGNIERRIIFDRSGSKPVYKVLYFSFAGDPISQGADAFSPLWEELAVADLCDAFSTTGKLDGNVNTITETCRDGTVRSQQIFERNDKGQIIRVTVKDAKDRSASSKFEYDSSGDESRWMHEIYVAGERSFASVLQFAQTKRDKHDNWIRRITTETISPSSAPNYQYIDERLITYYDE